MMEMVVVVVDSGADGDGPFGSSAVWFLSEWAQAWGVTTRAALRCAEEAC